MERIHESFCRGRKLSFFYGQYTLDKTPVFRRGAERCAVSPCATVYADGNYYLLADHPKREGYARYRVDKMTDARVLDDACAPPDPAFDPSQLADDAFSTRPEKSRWVSLAFQEEFVGEMIDRFGAGAPMVKIDERTWSVCAPVCVAPSFFGWVFQFGGGVRILAPDDVREEMALLVEAARAALNR